MNEQIWFGIRSIWQLDELFPTSIRLIWQLDSKAAKSMFRGQAATLLDHYMGFAWCGSYIVDLHIGIFRI